MVAGLTADTYLHAMSITKHKVNFKDLHLNKELLVSETVHVCIVCSSGGAGGGGGWGGRGFAI